MGRTWFPSLSMPAEPILAYHGTIADDFERFAYTDDVGCCVHGLVVAE